MYASLCVYLYKHMPIIIYYVYKVFINIRHHLYKYIDLHGYVILPYLLVGFS